MRRIRFIIILIFFVFVTIVVITHNVLSSSTKTVLEVWDTSTQEILAEYPVSTGDTIGLKFIHSYDRGTVLENFRVKEDGNFFLYQAIFTEQSYDGRELTFPNATMIVKDSVIYLNNIDEHYTVQFSELNIRVPHVVPQWIILDNQEIIFSSLASRGTLLQMKINNK